MSAAQTPPGAGLTVRKLTVLRRVAGRHLVTGEPLHQLEWLVDGVELLDAVRAAELPSYTAAGFPDAAGSYIAVREVVEHQRSSEHLQLMRVAREPVPASLLYVCSCGIEGCSAIVADVDRADGLVRWSRIRPANAARSTPRPFAFSLPDLAFEAAAYDEAFTDPLDVAE